MQLPRTQVGPDLLFAHGLFKFPLSGEGRKPKPPCLEVLVVAAEHGQLHRLHAQLVVIVIHHDV